jgi:transposase
MMVDMADLTDEQWLILEPLVMKEAGLKGGRPRVGDRQTVNAILWVLSSGEQWSHLPKKYGSYVTCWRRFREWEEDGTWSKLWLALLKLFSRREQLDWVLAFLEGNFVPGKKGASKQRLG